MINLPTIIVLAVLLVAAYFSMRSLRKNKGTGCRSCANGDSCAMKDCCKTLNDK